MDRDSANRSAGRGRGWPVQLLEGSHDWGSFEVAPANRAGWSHYRLTVFPPGTSAAERRALVFARRWPVLGAVIGLATLMIAGGHVAAAPLTLCVVLFYLAGFGGGLALTRQVRPGVRTHAVSIAGFGDRAEVQGDRSLLSRQVRELEQLDAALRDSLITPVQYEAGWWRVYDSLPSRTAVPLAGLMHPARHR